MCHVVYHVSHLRIAENASKHLNFINSCDLWNLQIFLHLKLSWLQYHVVHHMAVHVVSCEQYTWSCLSHCIHRTFQVSFSDQVRVSRHDVTPESGVPSPETVTSTPARPIRTTSPALSHSPVPHSHSPHSQQPLSHSSTPSIVEGSYVGYGCHKDGSSLPIVFDVKSVDLDDGGRIYCVWVSRNLVVGGDSSRTVLDWTLGATLDASERGQEVWYRTGLNR